MRINGYVDADHAHDIITRRSVTSILLFVNNIPIKWFSKRQKTVESKSYGSQLVAARIATEKVMEMRHNLRMLCVPIDGHASMLGDNRSVVLSTTMPSIMLNKKHNTIAYHRVRQAIAARILHFVHTPTEQNYADMLTKSLGVQKFYALACILLFQNPIPNVEDGFSDEPL